MKKIRILQFRKTTTCIRNEVGVYTRAFQSLPITLDFLQVFHENIDWKDPKKICADADGILLGGSSDLFFDGGLNTTDDPVILSRYLADLLEPLFTHIATHHIPTLGICFGHQILAHVRGVRILNDTMQAKMGSHEVILTEEGRRDPLFRNIPSQFTAQYGHKDSLSILPEGATLLAYGEQCHYSALRLARNIYSLQFHPELSADDIRNRNVADPKYLPSDDIVQSMTRESPHSTRILHNFIFEIIGINITHA